jgi:hypothetical protein
MSAIVWSLVNDKQSEMNTTNLDARYKDRFNNSYPNPDPEFQNNNEPIRLELAKEWDLRKLSTYLGPYLDQEAIDNLYPIPDRRVEDENTESDSESASD